MVPKILMLGKISSCPCIGGKEYGPHGGGACPFVIRTTFLYRLCNNHLPYYMTGALFSIVGVFLRSGDAEELVEIGEKIKGRQWVEEMGAWVERWPVTGSKGDQYTVSQKVDGTFGCSCPKWKFSKAPKPDCKHIRAMQLALGAGIQPMKKTLAEQTSLRGADMGGTAPFKVTFSEPVQVKVDEEFFSVGRKFRDR